jgi:hypothetical protein
MQHGYNDQSLNHQNKKQKWFHGLSSLLIQIPAYSQTIIIIEPDDGGIATNDTQPGSVVGYYGEGQKRISELCNPNGFVTFVVSVVPNMGG